MSSDEPTGAVDEQPADAMSRARRTRWLTETFGDVLPDTTTDDRDVTATHDGLDRWYQENRPPHHGG